MSSTEVTPTKIIRVQSVIVHHDDDAYVKASKQAIRHQEERTDL